MTLGDLWRGLFGDESPLPAPRPRAPGERVPLSELTSAEWVRWAWTEVTGVGDAERMFARGPLRTPAEAADALDDVRAVGWTPSREPPPR